MCIVYEGVSNGRRVRNIELCEYAQGNRPCAGLTPNKPLRVDDTQRIASSTTSPSRAVVIHQLREPRPRRRSFDAIDIKFHWKGPEYKLINSKKERMETDWSSSFYPRDNDSGYYPGLPSAIPPRVPTPPPARTYFIGKTYDSMVAKPGHSSAQLRPKNLKQDPCPPGKPPHVYRTVVVRPHDAQPPDSDRSRTVVTEPGSPAQTRSKSSNSGSAASSGKSYQNSVNRTASVQSDDRSGTRNTSPSPAVPPPPKSALKPSSRNEKPVTPRSSSEVSSSSSSTASTSSSSSEPGLSSSNSTTTDDTRSSTHDKHSHHSRSSQSSTNSETSRHRSDRSHTTQSSSSLSQSGHRRRRRRTQDDDEILYKTETKLRSALARIKLDETEARLEALRREDRRGF